MDANRRKANLLLLMAAIIWGFAFVPQRVGMRHVEPLTFNGIRFALGALTLLPFMLMRGNRPAAPQRGLPSILKIGLVAGLLIFAGSALQQYGLVFTTAGKAGFITGLYVVFVPLLGLLWGQRTGRSTWLGAVMAAVGLYLLSARGPMSIALGDGLVLLSALFWAGQVQWVGRWVRRFDPLRLAFVQFVTCAAIGLVGALIFEDIRWDQVRAAGLPILYTGIMSVGGAYTLQVMAQQDAKPAHAAIILSLEAVVAALGGWLVLGEVLPLKGLLGCALMFAGVMAAQLGPGGDPLPEGASARESGAVES